MRHFLELCIKSVEAALIDIDSEIIVIDNWSKDESCEMVKRKFPKIKLIENTENFGFSKGNNIAVKEAQGEFICILNPDTVVAEDTFTAVLKFPEEKRNIGILGCRLIDGQGRFLPESKRKIPTPNVAIKKMLGLTNSYYMQELSEKSIGPVPVFVGAFMLLRKSIYDEVNGFDEDYFMYGEDIDLSYKVSQAGYDNLYIGETTVVHYKGESTLKDNIYAKRFYGAMQIFYNKHFKSNVVFDTLVWLGIALAPLFKRPVAISEDNKKRYVLLSSEMNTHLEQALKQELILQLNFEHYDDDTEYILDNNHLSFRSVIEIISNTPKNCSATFKILPKNSNFIIGSNSSKRRGAIIPFDNN